MVGRLHVLTDFRFQQRYSHAALARLAIAGGADTIQFRHKEARMRDRWIELVPTAEVCRQAGVPLLVDDHLDLALAVGAAGVHVGQDDLPVYAARRVMASPLIVGATVTTIVQALEAEAAGADYLGFGPVFPTRSKVNPATVKGLHGLKEVCAAVKIPVLAIAGLLPGRVGAVLDAGAHGVAVMTAVTIADDPTAATAAFREALEKG